MTTDTTDTTQTHVVATTDDDAPPMTFGERDWPLPWMGAFLDAMAVMPNASAAARTAQVGRQYAYQVAAKYPEFREAWAEAREQAIEVLEQHVHRWGTVGVRTVETVTRKDRNGQVIETVTTESTKPHPTLAMFVLKKYRPEYRERATIEHTGPGGGPVVLEVDRVPTRERMLALAELARTLELPAPASGLPDIDGSAS